LKVYGYYKTNNESSENDVVSRMTKEIRSSTTWERRGNLKKKSQDSNKFKDRHFKLERDFLIYYKSEAERNADENFSFTTIHLGSAHIRLI